MAVTFLLSGRMKTLPAGEQNGHEPGTSGDSDDSEQSDVIRRALQEPPGGEEPRCDGVPVIMGRKWAIGERAAVTLSEPSSSFLIIISTAIMASSTRSPRLMISAPSEIRCRLTPPSFMATKVMARTSGIAIATTMPGRQPSDRKLTPKTMAMASIRVLMNARQPPRHLRLVGDQCGILGLPEVCGRLGGLLRCSPKPVRAYSSDGAATHPAV